ncbi:alpha/beta fold hydrolase [Mycobacteroides salmoniphilum]|uniref:3-oxoadipate enol-lactonase 2 n=1 Tax=Mycobacteroides salmoniphilum TaxID=404941 RepID=A0A4R8SYS7_9MYCO|nr:alpha/beta hydrolase [Mycobacteroides salmoniphilum]TDZ92554.1 3-oxoadipate enol-lactonase 2 [Mycobacteroides salmoniphilum]TEA08379.1 3-oxoadipate enol-lactonase 2 [Mycobacteroides salmoniphilum]
MVPLSSEVPTRSGIARNGDIELFYEDLGNPRDPAVILVMGVAAQLPMWPDGFCQQLLDRGYRVIRFDNRDCGLSTKLDGHKAPGSVQRRVVRYAFGVGSEVPYTLIDMAEDVHALIDHLELDTVHIAGASMGGMIVQVFAGTYPQRANSVGIIYSATGRAFSRLPSWELIKTAMNAPGRNASPEEWLEFEVNNGIVYNGPDNLPSREALRQRILDHRARSDYKVGTVRQFDAILGTGSLLRFTRAITAPTVVIHGRNDPLVPYQNGRVVAKNIRNSRFALIEGMGHDLPEPVWEPVAKELLATFERGTSRSRGTVCRTD